LTQQFKISSAGKTKKCRAHFIMNAIQAATIILFAASLLPLAICLVKMQQLKKYKAKAAVTTASVAASQKRRGMKNSTYYLLDIKYTIDTGVQYSAQTISWKKYAAGDTIPLMYLPAEPGNFKIDFGQSLKWLLPVSIILIIGIAWFCYWLLAKEYTYRPS
jgi:hypothetical protein